MQKLILFLALSISINVANAQKKKIGKATKVIQSVVKKTTETIANVNQPSLDEVVKGLKEALSIGADSSIKKLSIADGFFKNAAIKILMPPEAVKVESSLRKVGAGKLVDDAILTMNRAAESATADVKDIFFEAIKNMTINDGMKILKGDSIAATRYLKSATTTQLTQKIRPIVEVALKKVNATKYWSDVFKEYNRFSIKKVNPDLNAFVTEKTIEGLFFSIGEEEQKIRKDPAAQVTDLLKKVFGK
ncbi:MAG: DUF4197 domain-containing protein [Sphingobacteriales bacterium]|nr:DUF4197 domain-containing protein [Sphingobacteriales bacterium]